MKNIVIILLLSSYFLSTTELNQLLKVPVLISHFLDHKQNDNMSFYVYMSHHYGGHEKDADWDTDMKLPFMQHTDILHLSIVTPKRISGLLQSKIVLISTKRFSLYNDDYLPSSYLAAVWQPPKYC